LEEDVKNLQQELTRLMALGNTIHTTQRPITNQPEHTYEQLRKNMEQRAKSNQQPASAELAAGQAAVRI
jgi:hypothetical protein